MPPPSDLPDDDINPFINPDEELDVVMDSTELVSTAPTASSVEVTDPTVPSVAAQSSACDTPLSRTSRGSESKQKHPMKLDRRAWEAPGPSPLSEATQNLLWTRDERDLTPSPAPSARSGLGEGEEAGSFRSFQMRPAPLKIRPLLRTLAGRKKGRVSVPLRLIYLKNMFLSRIYALGVESPELDFVDEYSIEFLLDLQADLRRGHVTIPRLAAYSIADPPSIGTPRRRVQWRAGQTFPRRVEDYGRAAVKMLARRRSGME